MNIFVEINFKYSNYDERFFEDGGQGNILM